MPRQQNNQDRYSLAGYILAATPAIFGSKQSTFGKHMGLPSVKGCLRNRACIWSYRIDLVHYQIGSRICAVFSTSFKHIIIVTIDFYRSIKLFYWVDNRGFTKLYHLTKLGFRHCGPNGISKRSLQFRCKHEMILGFESIHILCFQPELQWANLSFIPGIKSVHFY